MDISKFLSLAVNHLLNCLYPPRCLCCGSIGQYGPGQSTIDLCSECERSLPWLKRTCLQCALPLADDNDGPILCGRCLKKPPFFDQSSSLFSFDKAIIYLIHQLKFHDRLAVSRLLGELLKNFITQNIADKPDCLLPVPLFKKRLRKRGFNQSIEIARSLAKTWNIPLDICSVERIRETQSQTCLDAKQRRKNMRGAFKVTRFFEYRHVAIIDDVVTTGSTVNELARLLKRNGVEKVSVYSIARASYK